MLPLATHQIPCFGILPGMSDRGDPELGARIRTLRKAAHMTQAELGAAIGVTRGHVSAFELGKRPVGRETLFSLARELDETLDFIAARDGAPGSRKASDDFEALWLMAGRELPREEAIEHLRAFMRRLGKQLGTS